MVVWRVSCAMLAQLPAGRMCADTPRPRRGERGRARYLSCANQKKRAVGFPTARLLRAFFACCYLLAKTLKVPNDRLSSEALLRRWKSVASRPVTLRLQ